MIRSWILQTLLDWGPGEGMHAIRWLGGTMERTILTEAGTGACSSRARSTRKADKTPTYQCLLGHSIVESGSKARGETWTRSGQTIASFLGGGSMASALVIVLDANSVFPEYLLPP